jgi:hypothetical protein
MEPSRKRLAQLSSVELLARAAEYRRMAKAASMPAVRGSLDKLAIRVAVLASARKILETDEQDAETSGRSRSALSELIQLAENAAACEPDPVRTLADAIRATVAGDADPYVLIGALVEGAVYTLSTRVPAVRQDDTAAALSQLLADRLEHYGLPRGV